MRSSGKRVIVAGVCLFVLNSCASMLWSNPEKDYSTHFQDDSNACKQESWLRYPRGPEFNLEVDIDAVNRNARKMRRHRESVAEQMQCRGEGFNRRCSSNRVAPPFPAMEPELAKKPTKDLKREDRDAFYRQCMGSLGWTLKGF